jgi:CheY-like chemotaxis protein
MLREFKLAAITLDIRLPDLDGWKVLDRLKVDLSTRHIPVQVITADDRHAPRWHGAIGFLSKTDSREELERAFERLRDLTERPVRTLLLVEDDERQTANIRELIGNGDVETTVVSSGGDALAAIRTRKFDCVILNPGVRDVCSEELIEQIKRSDPSRMLPVVIYARGETRPEEAARLTPLTQAFPVKDVRSPERLLDETALLLHREVARLPEKQRRMLEALHEGVLDGKKVLLVDDDIRNIFAMTSVLERFRMDVVSAENGKDAIDLLMQHRDFDIVLMDIMLPMMDGYSTIRAIRGIPEFAGLPIVAVTAKAMKGDREKCIAAGASDYLCKPVESEQMRSTLRLWLYRDSI